MGEASRERQRVSGGAPKRSTLVLMIWQAASVSFTAHTSVQKIAEILREPEASVASSEGGEMLDPFNTGTFRGRIPLLASLIWLVG